MQKSPLKLTKTAKLQLTVTTPDGTSKTLENLIVLNKLNKLSGSGLTSKHLYDLAKHGSCETVDSSGTTYKWTVAALAKNEESQSLANIETQNEESAESLEEALKASES